MENLPDMVHEIIAKPLPALAVIVNLIIIESLLSVDNAAVLATMVIDLPKDQRGKALKYGLIGAYIFRGICLLFASLLISIWWFKPLGGFYLLFLAVKYFLTRKKKDEDELVSEEIDQQKESWLYQKTLGMFGKFWATVISVELMDLVFSIDNVIAANAYTANIILIWVGVFIGILAMRFVAQAFVTLINKYPFLETCAYLVIGVLGLKLTTSVITHFYPCSVYSVFLEGKQACLEANGQHLPYGEHEVASGDVVMSVISFAIFIVPVITSVLFNFPRHGQADKD